MTVGLVKRERLYTLSLPALPSVDIDFGQSIHLIILMPFLFIEPHSHLSLFLYLGSASNSNFNWKQVNYHNLVTFKHLTILLFLLLSSLDFYSFPFGFIFLSIKSIF